jgi:hypothetical protein
LSAWLPVAIGIGVIMLESTELLGSNHTSGPLRWLWEAIFGPVANARWECDSSPDPQVRPLFRLWSIGVAWLRAWWMTLPRSRFLPDAIPGATGNGFGCKLR